MLSWIKEKLNSCKVVLKNEGIFKLIMIIFGLIYMKVTNTFMYSYWKAKYKKQLIQILNSELYDRIVLWRSGFGWNVTLFQRPQHIARELSNLGCLFFYEASPYSDMDVKGLKKVKDKLYLVNLKVPAMSDALHEILKETDKAKYLQIYSTEEEMTVEMLKQYESDGFKILYEYIDDLNPDISVKKELPKNIVDKYNYAMQNPHILVVVTATELENDVLSKRGNMNYVYSGNGVDVSHFLKTTSKDVSFNDEFMKVLKSGKKMIGYYGALAKWFDYDLIRHFSENNPDINVVLIGKIYDDSFEKSGINNLSNVFYIGPVHYDDLPEYAKKFDVCTIPFLVNELTNATSPLKLFEYMAMEKPIVTTAMLECKKYQSVLIANTYDEFSQHVQNFVNNEISEEYIDLLKKEADENNWSTKAKLMIDLMRENEKEC